MLSVLMLFLIYVGVCISIYQLYDIYCSQNVQEDELEGSRSKDEALADLSLKAREYKENGEEPGFTQAVRRLFGQDFDPRMVLAAFTEGKGLIDVEALLRRKRNIAYSGRVRIRHLSLLETNPPKRDIRGPLLSVVVVNTLIVLFLAGLSVFTTAYEFSAAQLSWANNDFILMLIVYSFIIFTHVLSKFDTYMHDLYKIGKLDNQLPLRHHDAAT